MKKLHSAILVVSLATLAAAQAHYDQTVDHGEAILIGGGQARNRASSKAADPGTHPNHGWRLQLHALP